MKQGTVVIETFVRENLSTASYDVTLGQNYYRELKPEEKNCIFNPYSKDMVDKAWGKAQQAETMGEWMQRTNQAALENISEHDRIIWLEPGESILAHTNEFIGGRISVTSKMQARSSIGRSFLTVCRCAGLGDVGFINRWTMEISNNSRYHTIPLVVGRRIAQVVFLETEGILDKSYEQNGKYQSGDDLHQLMSEWTPDAMLPKMYKDREVVKK